MSFSFVFCLYLSSYQSYAYRKLTVDRKTDCDFNGIKKSISEKMSVTLVCLAGDDTHTDTYTRMKIIPVQKKVFGPGNYQRDIVH